MRAYEKNIRKVTPYVPGEQPQEKVIKLNTNENPYPPSGEVVKALQEMEMDRFRLYPEIGAVSLVKELAKYHKVEESEVFVGVGSDDVLAMCFMTFFNSEKPIFFPDITYSFYEVWAELYKIPYVQKALDADLQIVKEMYLEDNGGIIFPNPNAPTAIYEEPDVIEEIIKANQDVIVIIDEAYVDYAKESVIDLIHKYENLLVVRTYSKSRSLAGLRIGYAVGNARLIAYLDAVKNSFNSYTMNLPSILGGIVALKDEAYFQETLQKIIETREWTKRELEVLGFEGTNAKTNFLFVTHPKYKAEEIFQMLKERSIYVRYFKKERIDNYLRITIGTREEMGVLLEELSKFIDSAGKGDL